MCEDPPRKKEDVCDTHAEAAEGANREPLDDADIVGILRQSHVAVNNTANHPIVDLQRDHRRIVLLFVYHDGLAFPVFAVHARQGGHFFKNRVCRVADQSVAVHIPGGSEHFSIAIIDEVAGGNAKHIVVLKQRTFQNINLLADEKNAQQFSACIIGWGGENHPRFVGEFGRCQILAHLGIRSVYDIIKIPPIPNVSDRLSLIIRDIALQIRKAEHTQLVGLHNAPQCRTHGCAGKRFTICQHIGSCP